MTPQAVAWLVLSIIGLSSPVHSQEPVPSPPVLPFRTVLTVYWSSENFPGTQELDAIILDVLRSRSQHLDYFAEYLESDRFPQEDATLAFRDYILRKYQDRHIDVVIAVTDVALQFALRYRWDLFPDAPIVFVGIAAPSSSVRNAGPGVTGILSGHRYDETLQLALKLHPSTRHVFYVAWASEPELREAMRAELQDAAGDIQLTDITEPSLARLLANVRTVPPGSLILFVRHSQDDAGNVRFPYDVVPLVVGASRVPVYGVSEQYVGRGVVGGVTTSQRDIGTHLANITQRILDGTRAQDIPIEHVAIAPRFDWRELRRWSISERSLPPHSTVLFRETSVWERHKTPIVLTVSMLLLQSLLIGGLVFERRRRRRAETESRRSLTAMAHLDRRAAMGELATSLAHELNQPLNAILQNAGVAQMLLKSNGSPALGEMSEIISDIRKDDLRASELIRRMRGLLQKHELESHPVNLNDVAQDTVAIVQPDAQSRGIQVELELSGSLPLIRGDRVHLQQVVLNLLMNALDAVAKTAPELRRVRVRTSQIDTEARMAVSDTGPGIPGDTLSQIFEPFYTTKKEGTGMGMGLAIARSIVEAHDGHIAVENNAEGGATVWFTVPTSRGPVKRHSD